MGGFGELEEFEKGLARLKKGLAGGDDWLKSRAPAYRDVAERTGVAVLMAMRPPEVDAAEWRERVDEFTDFLWWKAVTAGFEILYRKYEERTESAEAVEIRYQDVLEWVKAGAEEGGKDKSESEIAAGKTDEEIARVVSRAINQYRFDFEKRPDADYARITDRLEDWVRRKFLSADLSEVLGSVLDAWVATIGPMLSDDFDKWVDAQLEKL